MLPIISRSAGRRLALAFALACASAVPAFADTVIQQCGQQYQAAKAANTLNGMTWNQFRAECSAKLKATPAAVQTPAVAPLAPAVAAAPPPANPLKPVVTKPVAPAPMPTTAAAPSAPATPAVAAPATAAGGKPMSAGRTAFVARERQCGAEWRANKVTLVAQTPGLTWPKYLSSCNTRLKAAGQ